MIGKRRSPRTQQTERRARREAEARLAHAYAELKALDSLRNNFFSLVSHELRTPLTAIIGYAEFLEDGFGGELSREQQHFVRHIQDSAQRLEGLVTDLIDFAKLQSGEFQLAPTEADFVTTIRAAVASLAPLAAGKAQELVLTLPDEALVLHADHVRLGQVVSNLLDNAIKFSARHGRIEVTVSRQEARLLVTVSDAGPGIAPAHVARLFDKFYQVESVTTRAHPGAGLGLSIAKALVSAHHGTIGVDSTPGTGTSFWFSLPFSD